MNIYTINVVTNTKNKELYEKVAVNEYPLIIRCSNIDRLKEILTERQDYIKRVLKTETLYNHGEYFIREINIDNNEYTINEYIIPVSSTTLINYLN